MPDDVRDQIEENAQAPRRIQGDEGEIEEHSIPDQIAADRYLSGAAAAEHGHRGMRFTKVRPPGAS